MRDIIMSGESFVRLQVGTTNPGGVMGHTISRRSVAKGAAWGVPALTLGAPAAFAAASDPATVSSSICNLFYGGASTNQQTHTIFFQFASSTGTIAPGTIITHQVCVDPTTSPSNGVWNIPQATYPDNGSFTTTFTDASGAPLASNAQVSGKQCFNVIFTFKKAVDPSTYGCLTGIIWNDTAVLRPASTVTVSTNTAVTGPGVSNGGSGTLAYQAASRYAQGINSPGRRPHYFQSKGGVVTCYPSVTSSQVLQSDGFDDVVCFPSGTTITSARCNWGTSSCTASPTGLCTPPAKTGVTGQTTVPSMC